MLSQRKGQIIGFVQVNKPVVFTDRGYECAAWWEERTSQLGVYPVYLRDLNPLYPQRQEYHAHAEIPARVTDDYFPALWGGVSVSNKPYVCRNQGAPRVIGVRQDLTAAIEQTGNSPGSDLDWYIMPEVWQEVVDHFTAHMTTYYRDLPEYWAKYQAGDDEYRSRLRMVAYHAEHISEYARNIERVARQIGYQQDKSNMWRRLHAENTTWITKVA